MGLMREEQWAAVMMLGAVGLWLGISGSTPAAPAVVGSRLGPELSSLEARVSHQPDDSEALSFLVDEYLLRGAPGLAQAAIDRAPDAVRHLPEIADAQTRTLTELGQLHVALETQRGMLATCRRDGCPLRLEVRARRRAQVLEQMVRLGVDDPMLQPDRALFAYRLAVREVTLDTDR